MSYRSFVLHTPATRHTRPHRGASAARRYSTSLNDLETAVGFPRPKWLADFDYAANPAVSPAVINTLASCAWVRAGEPLCLIGDSGTGKSHLLIGLGAAAATAGFPARYVLAAKLVNELVEAAADTQLNKTIAPYARDDLLCIYAHGHIELDRRGPDQLFTVL